MSKYKLLAVDMDGTLLNEEKKISPKTLTAIEKLTENGVYVVTSTGRCPAELKDYRKKFALIRYGVLVSGALVYDFVDEKPIFSHPLDEATIIKLIDFATEENSMIHMHTLKYSIASEKDIRRMEEVHMGIYKKVFDRICLRVDDFKEYARKHSGEIFKVNLYNTDRQSRDRNFERMKTLDISIAFAEINNLEASPKGITKASGLSELCDFLDIDISETVAIGDGNNDKEIIQTAGLGIAMGNATTEIKQIADYVTLDNNHDGIAAAIEKFF
ncbi:MAG: Cof-type HAD-IIB family hydrolase [Selenomonadaceae bacterium]|nr:Cof-type HAD-IIB family hydrolase [Selenomonadaceae bacterium]